ncbi:hypothetical protein [Streptomyces sp. NPDC017991]
MTGIAQQAVDHKMPHPGGTLPEHLLRDLRHRRQTSAKVAALHWVSLSM